MWGNNWRKSGKQEIFVKAKVDVYMPENQEKVAQEETEDERKSRNGNGESVYPN